MWCLPSKNGEITRVWLDLPDPGKAFLRPLCYCCSLPAAARLDSVELRLSSPQPCSHSHPQTAGAALRFVFLLFLFGQKQRGIFFSPPWKNSSVWFEKGWGQEVAGKGCVIVFFGCLIAFLHLHQTCTGENWGFAGLPERCCRRGNIFHSPVASCVFLLTLSSLYRAKPPSSRCTFPQPSSPVFLPGWESGSHQQQRD